MYLSGVSNALATVKVKIFYTCSPVSTVGYTVIKTLKKIDWEEFFLEPLSSHVTKMNGHL